jgi:cell division protein FtsB
MATRKRRRRRPGGRIARSWLAVGALLLVGLLYYRPLHDYLNARAQQSVRVEAVRKLQKEQAALERRLKHASSLAALAAEARALGYIRPGEHLFIVKDIPQWRRRHDGSRRGH